MGLEGYKVEPVGVSGVALRIWGVGFINLFSKTLSLVAMGLGSQIPIKDHTPWLRDPNPRVQTLKLQRTTP